jgi:uncharacterized protein YjiS (DUF1127 family)
MTYIAHSTCHRPAARRNWLQSIVHAFAVARQRRALKELDDSALSDIGISRQEADVEARRPIWDAPSTWRC